MVKMRRKKNHAGICEIKTQSKEKKFSTRFLMSLIETVPLKDDLTFRVLCFEVHASKSMLGIKIQSILEYKALLIILMLIISCTVTKLIVYVNQDIVIIDEALTSHNQDHPTPNSRFLTIICSLACTFYLLVSHSLQE